MKLSDYFKLQDALEKKYKEEMRKITAQMAAEWIGKPFKKGDIEGVIQDIDFSAGGTPVLEIKTKTGLIYSVVAPEL